MVGEFFCLRLRRSTKKEEIARLHVFGGEELKKRGDESQLNTLTLCFLELWKILQVVSHQRRIDITEMCFRKFTSPQQTDAHSEALYYLCMRLTRKVKKRMG
jgi:hypothetical protein